MIKIFAIAKNTVKETIRDRILYVLLMFAILMCLVSIILGSLSIGNNLKIILDFGLASITIFGVILAIFIGTSLVFKEIDRRTVYIILTKPIERWEFIIGKFLGLCITLTFIVSLMSVVFIVLLILYKIPGQQLYLTFVSLVLIMLELYLMTAISILFSCFSTPLLSMAFALSIWVIGHFNPLMLMLADYANNSMLITLVTVFHYILPDLSKFNIKNNIDNLNYVIDLARIGYVAVYGILYTTVILLISIFAFNRKEFS
jgi:ABC-type transport system involved in multi-copper enzyme maturation permease subunit